MRWIGRLSLCALLLAAAGCMRFEATGVPAPRASGWRAIGQARVTTVENAYYVLHDVQVTADSVTGWRRMGGQRIALHRSQVRRFEQQRVARLQTGLLATAAVYVIAVYMGLRGMDW